MTDKWMRLNIEVTSSGDGTTSETWDMPIRAETWTKLRELMWEPVWTDQWLPDNPARKAFLEATGRD